MDNHEIDQLSNAEMMEMELRPKRPKFPKAAVWLYTRPYGFHLSALAYTVFALLLVIIGGLLSCLLNDGIWFARFGSLIVAIGIVFGIRGIEGKIDSDIQYCNAILEAIEEDEFDAKKEEFDGSFSGNPKAYWRHCCPRTR